MGSAIFEFVVTLVLAWLVLRFIVRSLTPSKPAEPGDHADTFAKIRPRPKSGAGAIAVAEPDEEFEEDNFDLRHSGISR